MKEVNESQPRCPSPQYHKSLIEKPRREWAVSFPAGFFARPAKAIRTGFFFATKKEKEKSSFSKKLTVVS